MNSKSLQQFIDAVAKFRNDREWQDKTGLKDTAIAINLETSEVLEHFKWKTEEEIAAYLKDHKNEVDEEAMDVLFNVLLLIDKLGIDVDKKFFEKMKKNDEKYPIDKVRGRNPHL